MMRSSSSSGTSIGETIHDASRAEAVKAKELSNPQLRKSSRA